MQTYLLNNETGLTGSALKWFILFITDYSQRECITDIYSTESDVGFGVPQGLCYSRTSVIQHLTDHHYT